MLFKNGMTLNIQCFICKLLRNCFQKIIYDFYKFKWNAYQAFMSGCVAPDIISIQMFSLSLKCEKVMQKPYLCVDVKTYFME